MIQPRRRALLAATLAAPAPVRAEEPWPRGRPLRVICPWPPGAANDAMARLLAQRLTDQLGAQAVVENRTGGAGLIGTHAVLQAPPDGYTLLASAFNTAVMPLVLKGARFNPQTNFEVLARVAAAPLMLVMTGQRPQRTLAEVIAAARAEPKAWPIAVSALGAAGHLATIDFLHRTGLDLDMVAYRGTQPALTDLLAGNAALLIDASFALLPATGDGRVRALGIATPQRSALAPMVPTLTEAGLPDFLFQSWYASWAPQGTPAAICAQVNALMQETMRDPAVVQRLQGQGLEPVTESIAETRRFIAAEITRATALLQSVNYQPE